MARSNARLSSFLLFLLAGTASSFTATNTVIVTTSSYPSRLTSSLATATTTRPLLLPSSLHLQQHQQQHQQQRQAHNSSRKATTILTAKNNDQDDSIDAAVSVYTPLDRPLLAIVDTISLTLFAAIGKSSHSSDGSVDLLSVLITAFPFLTAWLASSPFTGVYSPDDRNSNIVASTALKIGKGWIVAIPIGIVGRGIIKGYVPPVPFMIVTLISTLVILVGVRVLFSVLEDFFVELVN